MSLCLFGCSSADFEVGSAPDTGVAIAEDSGGTTTSDTAPRVEEETGREVGAVDAGPACDTTAPAVACSEPTSDYAPQFQYAASNAIGPLVDGEHVHAFSYVTARAGRHEKLILNLGRVASTGSIVGRLTLTAYRTPCPGVHIPLGKSRSFSADAISNGDQAFYFNETANLLPAFPAGTRLTFILSTDSTAFAFEVRGNSTGGGAPATLDWQVKKGAAGPWTTPPTAKPTAQAWLRHCAD
jgi:hypothetical protein